MNEQKNMPSRSAVIKRFLALFFLIGAFVLFHFLSVSPLFNSIVFLVCFGIGILLSRASFKEMPDESLPESSALLMAVRMFLAIAAFSIPVIAGQFLQFNLLAAFLIAIVSFFISFAAFESMARKVKAKSKIRETLLWSILFTIFFISFWGSSGGAASWFEYALAY